MRIRALSLAVVLLLLSLSVFSSAQILSRQPRLSAPPPANPALKLPSTIAPPPPPRKRKQPASKADSLKYFVGNWTEQGEWKASVLGPGGWFNTMDYNHWAKDHLAQRWAGGGEAGEMTYRYDSKEKVYTCHEADTKESADWEGTLRGDTWTWTNKIGNLKDGRPVRGRLIQKQLSPTSYDIVYEISVQGGRWTKVMTGSGYRTAK